MRWHGLAALVLVLAGCSSPAPDAGDDSASITTFTDPSMGRNGTDSGDHLHDYWGGKPEVVVVDFPIEVGGLMWGGPYIPVAEFRPESGSVVPQGASKVRVTIDWTDDDPLNRYTRAELWVKTAADSEPQRLADVEQGDTLEVESANERNDLPHQLLSAWAFQLVLVDDGPRPLIMYSGRVDLTAVAVRGLDIPLYPGHPDQWQGRTEIPLVDLDGAILFDGDSASGNFRCYAFGCPFYIVPGNGSIVPVDADHVTIVLEREQALNPLRLGVKYHSALTREFDVPTDMERTPTVTTYTIPVLGGGDGPYAKQSQWEFVLYIDEPEDDSWVYEDYKLSIVAYKSP